MATQSAFIKNRFLFLLISLIAFFLLNSILVATGFETYIFGVLFSFVLFFSIFTVEHRRWLIVMSVVLALMVCVGYWATELTGSNNLLVIDYSLAALFFWNIAAVIVVFIMERKDASFNTICGAVCGYLVLGIAYAFIYGIISAVHPHAFYFTHGSMDHYLQNLLYYSFVTLTTLGYGEITPITPVAKTIAWLEAATGQIYITVLIARLVSLQVAERYSRKK